MNKKGCSLYTAEECEKIAASASLRYIKDNIPGISRRKYRGRFIYYGANGEEIHDKEILNRIRDLAIPPAYQNVWICSKANGHIQATGRDDKRRKQYIYHPLWHEARQHQKFDSLIEFGRSLSHIRRHINKQLKQTLQLNKEQVICAIIYLLDTACIRIGTSRYAKNNQSFGLTTLRKKHLSITSNKAILHFPGKNAHPWHVVLKDKRLIKLLKKCEEIPGYELFKYYNEARDLNIVTSQDVNGYLQSLTKHPFTAKDFRTWIACRELFYRFIKKNCPTKENVVIQEVAKLLGHTPAICRKNYIDPDIISWWKEGRLASWLKQQSISLSNKDKLLLTWLESKSLSHNKQKIVESIKNEKS